MSEPAEGKPGLGTHRPQSLAAGSERDYIERNRALWQRWAPAYESVGRDGWKEKELRWGIWGVPESELRLLAGLEPGAEVIELGCGTAKVSAWLARGGFRPVAIDVAPAQLEFAQRLQREFSLTFPLICANAEDVQLHDATFDLAVSEYGASLWCEPSRWIPEAHRLLRPGGRLVFFTAGAFLRTCSPPAGGPAGVRLVRDYFSASRTEFEESGAVEFHLTHGDWIRLLGTRGFVLENLVEVRPRFDAAAAFDFATLEWARRWPSEEIWVARKAV